jgi:crotonobetainyl-CoA:carnitine CoA-transferase CaiB-like acyl-CoA transferase
VPCARYRTVEEAMQDPHLAVRGTLSTIPYGSGDYRLPNAAFQIAGSPTHARPYVADFDQDAEAVLGGILGYTQEQIAACRVHPDRRHK